MLKFANRINWRIGSNVEDFQSQDPITALNSEEMRLQIEHSLRVLRHNYIKYDAHCPHGVIDQRKDVVNSLPMLLATN